MLGLPIVILKVNQEDTGEKISDLVNADTGIEPGDDEVASQPYLSRAHLPVA